MLSQAGSVVSKRRDGSSWWFWLKIFCHSKSILSRDDDTGPSHCRRQWDPGGPAPQWTDKKKNNLKLSALFYKISKNLTAFTVFRASNDTQQLSLATGLQLNPVVHVTITQREGGISIRCPTRLLV